MRGLRFYSAVVLGAMISLLPVDIVAQDLNPIRWTLKSESSAVKAGDKLLNEKK